MTSTAPVSIQASTAGRRFQLILLKPSHYDDDGYVIRWWRAMIPSNSLAALYGIGADCAQRQVLGPGVSIDIEAIDEMNTRIGIPRLIARMREHARFGLVALVGVQSNQYPRALDIARPFREAGIQVAIGGFHVSGCLSMLDGSAVELDACREMGITMFAGEAEGRFEGVLRDAADGQLQSVYNFLNDLPDLDATCPSQSCQRATCSAQWATPRASDAGRGCPYQCSFCTIINVQGRKVSSSRSPDDVERAGARELGARHPQSSSLLTTILPATRDWEAIFDRLIELKEHHGIPLGLLIQVDTLCHKIPNFVEKAKRAGVTRVFIGLENVNPDNLDGGEEAPEQDHRVPSDAAGVEGTGYYQRSPATILGFPLDTPETIRRDIEIIKRELAVDMVEFLLSSTPLPGSEDHQKLWTNGIVDGCRPQPLRPGACLRRPPAHEPAGMAADLPGVGVDGTLQCLHARDHWAKTLLKRAAVTGVPMGSLATLFAFLFATTMQLGNVCTRCRVAFCG